MLIFSSSSVLISFEVRFCHEAKNLSYEECEARCGREKHSLLINAILLHPASRMRDDYDDGDADGIPICITRARAICSL